MNASLPAPIRSPLRMVFLKPWVASSAPNFTSQPCRDLIIIAAYIIAAYRDRGDARKLADDNSEAVCKEQFSIDDLVAIPIIRKCVEVGRSPTCRRCHNSTRIREARNSR